MYSGMPSLQVECPMCRLPITYNLTQLQSFASKELKEEEVCCFSLVKCVQECGCCLQNYARMVVFCIFACINTKGEFIIYSNPRRTINPYIITPLDVLYFILRLSPSCFKYVLFFQIVYKPSEEIRKLQKKMASLFEKQKKKGGIINIEQERNRFLIDITSVCGKACQRQTQDQTPFPVNSC